MAIFCWWVILNVMRPTMRGRNTPKYFGRDEIISHIIRPLSPRLPSTLAITTNEARAGRECGIFIGDGWSCPRPGTFLCNYSSATPFLPVWQVTTGSASWETF